MPPSAAPECERVGCSFEIIATSAPASKASMAARMPAQPAPTTRTSCSPITPSDATSTLPGPASEAWSGLGELRIGEPLEVLAEHLSELARLPVVRLRIAPGRPRVEQRRLDARHRDRHVEAEDLVGAELHLVELARESGVEQCARRRDGHPPPLSDRAAGPARVHEPHVRAVLVELLAEHIRVHRRPLREERRSEACRERRLR